MGPEFSYLIEARSKSANQSNDLTDFIDNKFEVSGAIGLNYDISNRFSLKMKYNHGLTCLSKLPLVDDLNHTGIVKLYGRYFQISLRYNIKKEVKRIKMKR